ncbi:MAG: 2Fe-2S iron-sulfur cluster-binding protein [Saprospiraceae bacterium]
MEDIIIKVIDRKDITHELVIPKDCGFNLMEICKSAELGVLGICGGIALCGSCHVYVNSQHELPDGSDEELVMLDSLYFVESNSRLSCQIKITESLHGLEIKIAPDQ